MNVQNKPQTLTNARSKIAQLSDATDRSDLLYRLGVASGWLAALCLEEIICRMTFCDLCAELNETFREVGDTLQPDC